MNNILEKITFFIVCYKSTYIIDFCLRSLPKESKKIIIDNTNNEVLKKDIEGKYNNLEIILNKNNGYGSAANLAISKIETEYAFLLNPDVSLLDDTINNINNAIEKLKGNFSILTPELFIGVKEDYKKKNFDEKTSIIEVNDIKGCAVFFNLKKIPLKPFFDENIFLYHEETDLCHRINKSGGKVYHVKSAEVIHLGKVSTRREITVELLTEWHFYWSLYYYHMKHFGKFAAIKEITPKMIGLFSEIFFSILFLRKKKFIFAKYKLSGLINSIKRKPSWLRLENVKLK